MIEHPLLAQLAKAGMKMGLGRMHSYLSWLQDPQLACPVVHVAGTNGKGSVCRILGAILESQGYKVGITTSPHLQEVNERIRIGSRPISDAQLNALVSHLDTVRTAWARATLPPNEQFPLTYFEFTTAMAFQHFAQEKVDVAVVEVGMGGRLDATNVCSPILTSIVTVGLDHTEHLGPDHASIAAEKAGILKNGVPAVLGPLPGPALAVVRSVAAEKNVPLSIFGTDFQVYGTTDAFHFRGRKARSDLRLSLGGDHQLINAAVALELADQLPPALACSEEAVHSGLLQARNRGRLEWLAPDLLVDGAHNPDGAQVLAGFLKRLPRDRPRILVLGGGTDKDLRSVATILAPQVDRILTTACNHPKARPSAQVHAELSGLHRLVEDGGGLESALLRARDGMSLVIVAGSLYLVGAVRDQVGVN